MAVFIDKADIIASLRAAGRDGSAEWVDRQLPDLVDTHTNSALLQMLNIDLSTIPPVETSTPR